MNASSEPMPIELRREIERSFGVPVGNTFASTEGLVGVAPPGEDALCFAEDACILELVDHEHRPVAPGTVYELTDCFCDVQVTRVPAIPRDPHTGKARRFVPFNVAGSGT